MFDNVSARWYLETIGAWLKPRSENMYNFGRSVRAFCWRSGHRSVSRLIQILLFTVIGASSVSIHVLAQSTEKTVGVFPSRTFAIPQVKIKSVQVGEISRAVKETRQSGGALQTLDENFTENSDWLSRTSFQIVNVSGKPMIYLKINVRFPETIESGSEMVYSISFGRRPGLRFQNAPPFLFKPNDALDVPLGAKYSDISAFVSSRRAIESMNKIQLEVSYIAFDDGSAWSVGTFMVPDPNDPGRYIDVGISPPAVAPVNLKQ
jgi:hypothetical protein